MKNNVRRFKEFVPEIDDTAFIDPSAVVIGNVRIGKQASIWPFVAIRGDVNSIEIGQCSNIQESSILHVTHRSESKPNGSPLIIGEQVTVGHGVTLHGCTIGNRVLIGMNSCVLDDVVIEDYVMVGAGSLVPPKKLLKSGFLYMGSPAKPVRLLTEKEKAFFAYSAEHYQRLAAAHQESVESV